MFNWFSNNAAIKATELPMLAGSFTGAPPRSATSSQLGGLPWWPAGKPYPVTSEGLPQLLLAQINFGDAPALDPFPRSGLLQIFIGRDDTYGCNFGEANTTDTFACVFHERTDAPVSPPANATFNREDSLSPLDNPLTPLALAFHLAHMPVDPTDYRMEKLLPKIAASDKQMEGYHNSQKTPAIRLGGYPSFTQDDPRRYPGRDIGDFNLLTVDTTDGIMWGDSGVAQFFIHEDDLRRRDFSRVVYNWDCC